MNELPSQKSELPRSNDPEIVAIERVRDSEIHLPSAELVKLMHIKLDRGLPFRFQARGWSMAPFIRDQDVITLASLKGKMPGIGEIVAFVRPGDESLVIHRVVGRKANYILIKGDGNDSADDGWILNTNILGKVTRVERNGQIVWLGRGLERFAIAWLSRFRLLSPLRRWYVEWRDRFFPNQ